MEQVRRGQAVRQEQGPSPPPPLSPSLFNKTAHHLHVHRWGSQRLRLCRAMAPEQVGSGYLSSERMETLEESGSSR